MKRSLLPIPILLVATVIVVLGQDARDDRWAVQEPMLRHSGYYRSSFSETVGRKLAVEFALLTNGKAAGTVETIYGERDSKTGAWDIDVLTNRVSGTWMLKDDSILIVIEEEKSEWIKIAHRLSFPDLNGIKVAIMKKEPKDEQIKVPNKPDAGDGK
jgi:hypothetical protein